MERARSASKVANDVLLEHYRNGALVPHLLALDQGTRPYTSWADCEAVLAPINNIQDDDRLHEFITQFMDNDYAFDRNNLRITGARISYPHTMPRYDMPPPSPLLSDDQILAYLWPNGRMNREGRDYVGALWIDIGQEDTEFEVNSELEEFTGMSLRTTNWQNVLAWPTMVGSNKCNVAALRSYLDDTTPLPAHLVTDRHRTVSERARYLLDDLLKIEMGVPDGYFVIHGKMKRINIADKLQMNMIYTIKVATQQTFGERRLIPIGQRISEVRSLRAELGLAYHQVLLTLDPNISPPRASGISREDLQDGDEGRQRIPRGSKINREVFKFYNSILSIMIDKEFEGPINIFDLLRGYGLIMAGTSSDRISDDFIEQVRQYSNNNIEIMRPVLITRERSRVRSDDDIRGAFRGWMAPANISVNERTVIEQTIRDRFRKKFLPHCEVPGDLLPGGYISDGTYQAKLRFLAMMVIELMLTVLGKKEVTDRKDFIYKRWESAGYLLRDYVRSLFLSQRDIQRMTETASHLVTFMNQNQWPARYRPRGTYKQQKTDHRDGIVDDVPKYNVVSMVDAVRTVKISAKSGVNTASVRRIHASQWGFQCPANTPENANIGLNNNLAEAVLITDELTHDETDALNGILDALPEGEYLLMVDGNPMKYVSEDSYETLLSARRDGSINRGIGLARHVLWVEAMPGIPLIVVRTAHGRPIFPAFILDQEESKLERILSLGQSRDIVMDDLFNEHLLEYVDAYEMVYNVVVAPWIYAAEQHFLETREIPYTHAMIMPNHIYSQATSCLIFPEHEPSARETYATQHTKQAIGRPFEYPEERYDHEVNFLNMPEAPLISTATARRLNMKVARNLKFAFMSLNGNVDDAIHFSESLARDPRMQGFHFNIFESDRGINESNRYNWQLNEDMEEIIDPVTGQGLIDPEFSDSVIVPYGDAYITEVDTLPRMVPLRIFTDDPILSQITAYQVESGKLHIRYGAYRPYTIEYVDTEGNRSERVIRYGEEAFELPGRTRVGARKGPVRYRLALAFVREDMLDQYDTPFIDRTPLFTARAPDGTSKRWYGPSTARIPRVRVGPLTTNMGRLGAIRQRRQIQRGEVAIRILERNRITRAIEDVSKERFDITFGHIESIEYGAVTRIKGAMPIGPKEGNKYAAFYAQKGVCARIIPDSQMPKAKYFNPVTQREEEFTFDAVFNPLGIPSRMTLGMVYEAYIAGALYHLYNIPYNGGTLRTLYENDPDEFDEYMNEAYNLAGASQILELLTDNTAMMYDDREKIGVCERLRAAIGIPSNGLYDVYLPDENGEWTRRVENQINCGVIYYGSLRHLVDNKRRARGYVGKRDPLTYQPVKGRRRNGGANTGTMETDAYKAHGASAMLLERMSRVSDYKLMLKCPHCGGLVSVNEAVRPHIYTCQDCGSIIQPADVIEHDTVMSWHLFRMYCRGIGINITEHFT